METRYSLDYFSFLLKTKQTNKQTNDKDIKEVILTSCSTLSDLKCHVCRLVNLYAAVTIPQKKKNQEM